MAQSVSGSIFHDLYYLYMGIALVVGGLVLGWLGYILVKYRARPGEPRPRDAPKAGVLPAERGHPIWSYVMALVIAGIMFGLAFGTISATTELETPPPPEEVPRIDAIVAGFQFGWRLTYPGEGGVPIARVTDWTIPVDTAIAADVVSQDVWHNFALVEYRIRIDVVPGQTNRIWWMAKETGTIEPVCVQLCGNGHAQMRTTMHVVERPAWEAYVAEQSGVEYRKLANASQVVNVTFDGAGFAIDAPAAFNASKGYALRFAAPTPVTLTHVGPDGPVVRTAGGRAEPELLFVPGVEAQLAAPGVAAATVGGGRA